MIGRGIPAAGGRGDAMDAGEHPLAPSSTVTLTDGTVVQRWLPAAPPVAGSSGAASSVRHDTAVLAWRSESLPHRSGGQQVPHL